MIDRLPERDKPRRRGSEPVPFDVCRVDVFKKLVDFQSQRFLVVPETAVVSRPMIDEDILGDVTCCCFHFDGELNLLL